MLLCDLSLLGILLSQIFSILDRFIKQGSDLKSAFIHDSLFDEEKIRKTKCCRKGKKTTKIYRCAIIRLKFI